MIKEYEDDYNKRLESIASTNPDRIRAENALKIFDAEMVARRTLSMVSEMNNLQRSCVLSIITSICSRVQDTKVDNSELVATVIMMLDDPNIESAVLTGLKKGLGNNNDG